MDQDRIARQRLEDITRQTEDIACIIIIEDALAKIYTRHHDNEETIIDCNRAGAFLEEIKYRIKERTLRIALDE